MTTHITKTWFDGEKVVTQEIPESEVYKQEPVAWADMDVRGEDKGLSWTPGHFHTQPLYTTPPAQEFVCSTGLCHYKAQPALKPLTNEQVGKAARDAHIAFCLNKHQTYEHALTRAVEAAHGITGETK